MATKISIAMGWKESLMSRSGKNHRVDHFNVKGLSTDLILSPTLSVFSQLAMQNKAIEMAISINLSAFCINNLD